MPILAQLKKMGRNEYHMKVSHAHKTNFSNMSQNSVVFGDDGFAPYHKAERYGKASMHQLEAWAESRLLVVRNATYMELEQRGAEHAVK